MTEAIVDPRQQALELGLIGQIPRRPERMQIALSAFESMILPGRRPDAGLVDSIEQHGVLMPIIVCQHDEGYQIIDGLGRVSAALKVRKEYPGRDKIPALVYRDVQDYSLITLTANHQRSYNAVAEAQALRSIQAKGMSVKAISKLLHIPEARIKRRLLLLELPQILWYALTENKLRCTVAEAVARLNATQQAVAVSLFEANGKLTAEDVRRLASEIKDQAVAQTFDGLDDLLGPSLEWSEPAPDGFPDEAIDLLQRAIYSLESYGCDEFSDAINDIMSRIKLQEGNDNGKDD